MTEILFGQSYYLRFDPKLWRAMQPYPPLGTLYAAAYVRERGYPVALFDAMLAESDAQWDRALARVRPRFAVLYEDNFNYVSKMCLLRMREAALRMVAAAKARGSIVIVAGSDATDHAPVYLVGGADYVIIGEGEETLGELLDALTGRSGARLHEIRGLAFVDERRVPGVVAPQAGGATGGGVHCSPALGTGRGSALGICRTAEGVVFTPPRPVLRDLDALPWPAWELVDVERYREVWLGRHGYFSMNAVTTRGCPFHCNWCAKPIWGQRYNVRSPESVAAELRWLKERYGPDRIWFADDILGLKPGWLSRFAEAVDAYGARIPFKCLSRPDLLLRDGDIDALRRAGAEIVWVGAESGSQKILDAMEKGTRVEQIHEATRRLHAAGIRVGFFLQFGYPGETREDIAATLRLVREARPDDIGISVSYPLPGTKFYQAVQAQLGSKRNWVDSDDLAMMFRGPYSTAFYRALHRTVHKEFRARKTWRELKGAVRERRRLQRRLIRRAVAMLWQTATLPLERAWLRVLEWRSHDAPEPLPVALHPGAAATPTPQVWEAHDEIRASAWAATGSGGAP